MITRRNLPKKSAVRRMNVQRGTLRISCVPGAHIRIKIRKRAGDGILGAGISLMQTIIIKSNAIVRSQILSGWVSITQFVTLFRGWAYLAGCILGPCALCEVKDVRRARGRDSAIWRTTSGDASRNFHNHRARLGAPLFRVRVLLVASTRYHPSLIFRRPSAFIVFTP